MAPAGERIAAVDIGTNSIHMIVVELRGGGYRVVDREKETVQLGLNSLDGAPLTDEAMDRAVAALDRMRQIAERRHARDIVAVATSAVREAPNRREFLRRVRREAGIEARVISGEEEAELIYRAVRSAVELGDRTAVCIDVGGGSVEIIVGRRGQIQFAASEPLGALRLAERYSLTDDAAENDVEECRRFVRRRLRRIQKQVTALKPDVAVGTSGTVLALVSLSLAGRRAAAHGLRSLSGDDVAKAVASLATTGSEERAARFGLDRKRAQTILAGAIVIHELMEVLSIETLLACPAAMREGIIESRIARSLDERGSVRRTSVLALATRMGCDMTHGRYVAALAVAIFDALRRRYKLAASGRELLEYAALLHESGLQISERGHDRHTDYIVRHGELKGFTDEQLATVATVARFYRKDPPDDLRSVHAQRLCAILRIAEGLDRSHGQRVRNVGVSENDGALLFEMESRGDISVEIESAKKRAKYFRTVFGVKARFKAL